MFSPEGKKIYFIGIKGTGMAALAEMFKKLGADVSGSDTEEKFYTDEVLKSLSIPFHEGFSRSNIEDNTDLVIHSSAYSREKNPELAEAYGRGLEVKEYSEALGLFSGNIKSCGVAGVHGKTTTTGLLGTVLKEMGLPVSVLAGSAVSNFDGKSTYVNGNSYFIAETCEYKRHFLSFHPDILIVTSIEPDHLDYFRDYDDIFSAFYEYVMLLPEGGTLVYCADDRGASELAAKAAESGKDINLIPYGLTAEGKFRVEKIEGKGGSTHFKLAGFKNIFEVRIPGVHTVLNSAASVAAALLIESDISGRTGSLPLSDLTDRIAAGLASFRGSKRRSEILGEAAGILFMDDYAHHPTALKTTLSGIRNYYPGRRIVVDFMSHTYSRTEALFDDFASSFGDADLLVINRIYASARERGGDGGLNGKFFRRICDFHKKAYYFEEPLASFDFLASELEKDDIFITMGAGDNWVLGRKLYNYFLNGEV